MKLHKKFSKIVCQAAKMYIPVLILAAFNHPIKAQEKSSFAVNNQINPLKDFAIPSSKESHPFFVDIDGDGDLDCFSGEYTKFGATIYYYRNEGNSKKAIFKTINGQANPLNNVEVNTLSIPYFIDIDGDNDFDCFIGEGSTGALLYYKNVGSATKPDFQKQSAAFNPLSMVKFSAVEVANPAFADIDSDGDYDCLIADEGGNLNYYKNTGTVDKPAFAHITGNDNPFQSLSAQGGVYNVSLEDWSKKGLVDLFINTTYYKNTGTRISPKFSIDNSEDPLVQNTSADKNSYTPLRWVDLNNDGNVEVVQGTATGKFIYQTLSSKKGNVAAANPVVSMHVLPNPSKNEFTLNISPASPSVIRIIDVQGKLVSTRIASGGIVKFGSELQAGIYILQVAQNNKVVYTQKIIKE